MPRGQAIAHVPIAAVAALVSIGCTIDAAGLDPLVAKVDGGGDAATVDAPTRDAGLIDTGAVVDAFAPDTAARDAADLDAAEAPDAAFTCDGAACPCDALIAFGKLYLFCTDPEGWHTARDECEALAGFRLVSIESADEDAFIWNEARARNDTDWWIGLYEPEAGVYAWTDGTEIWNDSGSTGAYHNFAGGAPEYSVPDDCGQLSSSASGEWDEGRCGDAQPFVCEAI